MVHWVEILNQSVDAVADMLNCAWAQSISQCVDAGQLNIPP